MHTEDDHPLMFWCVLCYPAKVCFRDMISVQEGHLSIWFNPHLAGHKKMDSIIPRIRTLYLAY